MPNTKMPSGVLLTKREREQLQRSAALLDRIRDRARDPDDDDDPTIHAVLAEDHILDLLTEDERLRVGGLG